MSGALIAAANDFFSGTLRLYTTVVTTATESCPGGASSVEIEVWGGGGGGAGNAGGVGGGGGGGGGYSRCTVSLVGISSPTLVFTVGTRGTSGGGIAVGGGDSIVKSGSVTISTITCHGGGGGAGGTNGASGGGGGTATNANSGAVNTIGGAGGAGGASNAGGAGGTGITGNVTGDGSPYGTGGGGLLGGAAPQVGAVAFNYT